MPFWFGLVMVLMIAVPAALFGMVFGSMVTLAAIYRREIYGFLSRLFAR